MMYDPLAIDRQRQNQDDLRRRTARDPRPVAGPKPPREAHRRHLPLRRLASAISSS
ncbi:MAG TPA: hypothetical protein VFJ17_06100 [Mycobacteriales bacterium]|jgi:hypothetical protein|nr:hypothetical protein [Mycobacteriales bacterium]